MNAFIIDLRCARFIYCATLVRAFSFCEAFLHKEATWSSKRKLLLKRIPSSFWFELLLIVSFLTLILILPVVFTSRWHSSGLALRQLFENQSKSCSAFSSSKFTMFSIFTIMNSIYKRYNSACLKTELSKFLQFRKKTVLCLKTFSRLLYSSCENLLSIIGFYYLIILETV